MIVNAKGKNVHGSFVNNKVSVHSESLERTMQACPAAHATGKVAEDILCPFVKECDVCTIGTNVQVKAAPFLFSWGYGAADAGLLFGSNVPHVSVKGDGFPFASPIAVCIGIAHRCAV